MSDTFALIASLQQGLPFSSLVRLEQEYRMTRKESLSMLGMNASTAKCRQHAGKMSLHEGERIMRYARLLDLALSLMEGDKDDALRWLVAPAPGLGGQKPLDVAVTDVGAHLVEKIIHQIEHGVLI